MKKPAGFRLCCTGILASLLLVSATATLRAADAVAPEGGGVAADLTSLDSPAPTNVNVTSEMLISTQMVEQLRREIEQSAERNAEAINASLSLIEPALSRLQERQMEAVQSSNRTILMVAGIFAAVGFLGLVFITLILVRAVGRFSELAVLAGPRGQMLGAGQPMGALGQGEMFSNRPGAAEQASGRFQGAIEQLQKRIMELEQSVQVPPAVGPASASPHRVQPMPSTLNIEPLLSEVQGPASNSDNPPPSRVSLLMGKGQALLNLDAAEPALQCFEEALAMEPDNAEALVKRGMALEKLQDWEQALASYDRALAIDGALTVAHLYRGGVCNRLQRYHEALESYERALRTEKKSRAL